VDDADAVVGFAIAIALVDCDAALLEYMAVEEKRRGAGIGKLLFRAIAGWPEAHDRFLLMEVDSTAIPSPDGEDRARRKEFYRGEGCMQVEGLRYVMPRVSGDAPPLMDLLVYRRDLPDSVEKARVHAWLEACYAQVYQQTLPDVRIDEMLASLGDRIRIE
jgi:hypothetical protein